MLYFVPRYFPRFSCKMGACRNACCTGWPVTVSMKNYFTLLGMPCRKELRDRLDCALRVADHPTEEEYARFSPNWLGECPMRMEDGRCSLQAELGEEALSDVCRLYPRGVRVWEGRLECSASNSCEKTLELLWEEREPMTFAEAELAVVPPPHPGTPAPADGLPVSEELRFAVIRAMQDRGAGIGERILSLRTLLGLPAGLPAPEEDRNALETGLGMLRYYADRSASIRDTASTVLERYGAAPGRYAEDAETFCARFPDHGILFEQALVNHLFYTQFPYIGVPLEGAWKSLAAVYGLLRLLCVGGCAACGTADRASVVDIAAAAFRLIAHTPFERSVDAALEGGSGTALLRL